MKSSYPRPWEFRPIQSPPPLWSKILCEEILWAEDSVIGNIDFWLMMSKNDRGGLKWVKIEWTKRGTEFAGQNFIGQNSMGQIPTRQKHGNTPLMKSSYPRPWEFRPIQSPPPMWSKILCEEILWAEDSVIGNIDFCLMMTEGGWNGLKWNQLKGAQNFAW